MKKNLLFLFIANTIKSLYQWSLLILIVKFLSKQDVGLFTLAFSVTAPIFMFFNMQLRSIYVVDYRKTNYDFNYFIIRLITTLFALISVFFYSFFSNYNLFIMNLVSIIKSIESLSDIIYADFQKKEFMHFMSISIILQSLVSLTLFTITLYFTNNLEISLLSIIFTLILICIFYDLKILIKINKINLQYVFFIKKFLLTSNNIKFIKQLLLNAFPLGISVFIGSYSTNLPRIYVEKYLGIEQLAYFGAMSYMSIGFFQLILPIQTVLRPKLAKLLINNNYNLFIKYLILSIFFTASFGIFIEIIFYIFGDYILMFIYNKDYINYLNILLLQIIAQTILTISVFLNIAVQTFYVFKIQFYISLISFLFSILKLFFTFKKRSFSFKPV